MSLVISEIGVVLNSGRGAIFTVSFEMISSSMKHLGKGKLLGTMAKAAWLSNVLMLIIVLGYPRHTVIKVNTLQFKYIIFICVRFSHSTVH